MVTCFTDYLCLCSGEWLPVLLIICVFVQVNVTCFTDYLCLCSGEWLPVLLFVFVFR